MRRRLFLSFMAQLSARMMRLYTAYERQREGTLREVLLGLAEVVEFAEVPPVIFVGAKGEDLFALTGQAQIGRDDGERPFLGYVGQQAWRNNVNAGKGQRLQIWSGAHEFRFLVAADSSSAQFSLVVEKHVARAFPLLDCERCQGAILAVKLHQTLKIDFADHIHIVKNERLVQAVGILQEEPGRLFEAATGVEQKLLAGNFHSESEIVVGFQVLNHQIGKVVHVYDDVAHAEGSKTGKRQFQQRSAADFHQRFGAVIRQRAQARAEAGRQNHGPHRPIFSNSKWRTATSTPAWP